MRKKIPRIPHTFWRRLSQWAFLLLFFFLFIKTDYTGSDEIEYAVNILFRIDPLLAASVMLAVKTFVALMLPALALIVLTLILGRFFCGWVCPMGALIDLFHPLLKPGTKEIDTRFPQMSLIILLFVLVSALFGLPMAGYFDPFSILVRGLSLSAYPALNDSATTVFTFTYREAPPYVNAVTEPVYAFLKKTILPYSRKVYALSLLSGFILVAVFLAERIQQRFFCRNICPLGALLGLTARTGPFKGHGGSDDCRKCRACRSVCRMGAIDPDRRIAMNECILCLDCLEKCPRGIIAFRFSKPVARPPPVSLTRRSLMASMAAGAILPMFTGSRAIARVSAPLLIRPPGALAEDDFLERCVRCGECMKVCIGNALHPAFLESGIEGMFSPRLIARIGYCEFNCTLCGQVCPTGANMALPLEQKHTFKIGHAFFDKNRCLPYAKGIPCIVCEEHCPTPEKAIEFNTATVKNDRGEEIKVKQPYIVDRLCIGCGICENKCPLPDQAAVRVTAAGEQRHPQKTIPASSMDYY
jgi:polyferredoxin/formate hydrogenlyase subunit 6/NADH:ubiquinone oxidoreductase subunit I